LYYLDETGFCLIPSVGKNIGEYLTLKSRRSPRLNVLGIMNQIIILKLMFHLNSDVIITCIDAFYSR